MMTRLIACVASLAFVAVLSAPVEAGCLSGGCGQPECCEPAPVCCTPCPPPPVEVSWCVTDPCDPCAKYTVKACLPACCANEVPCLAGWRKGFLGRKVLTYKFPGCGECVEVVITRFGRTIVR